MKASIGSKRAGAAAVGAMRSSERGITVIEVMVSMALLSVVSLLFYESYVGTQKANQFLECHGDLNTLGQKAVNAIKNEIVQSRYMFQNDTIGNAYSDAIQLPSGITPATDSRLPVIDIGGNIRPDTGTETRTGNALLMARQLTPIEVEVDIDGDGTTDATKYLADRYQMLAFFLREDTAKPFLTVDHRLLLMKAQSRVFADYFQLSGLSATARTQVARALYNQGVRTAWDPAKPVATAFYSIGSSGTLTGPDAQPVILMTAVNLLPAMERGHVSGGQVYSVGITNAAMPATPDPVQTFAVAGANFPGGLEFQAVGPPGARKVMVRLCLMANTVGKITTHVSTVTATTIQM